MPNYQIKRTELLTRVWIIEAPDEESAFEDYLEVEDIEELSYLTGHPDVTVRLIRKANMNPVPNGKANCAA